MTGIILAGGKSSRFSGFIEDKAFLPLGEKTCLQWIIDKFREFFEEIIIVVNRVEKFTPFGLPVVKDIYPAKGPLSGIHSALFYTKSFYNFILACDLPLVKRELIRYLISLSEEYDAVIPWLADGAEPLCGIYSKNCLPLVEEELKSGENSPVSSFLERVNLRKVGEEEIKKFDPELISFFNLNTPANYEQAKKLLKVVSQE